MLTIALLLFAGPAAATGGEMVTEAQGQAEATAEAHGSAYADGSEAVKLAEEAKEDTHGEIYAEYNASMDAYGETKADARESFNETGDDHEDRNVSGEMETRAEQHDEVAAEHEDEAEQSAETDTEPVDAGAEVGVFGHVSAFFDGALDALVEVTGQAERSAPSEDEVKAEGNQHLDTASSVEGEVRGQVDGAVSSDAELPDVEPSVSTQGSAETVTEASAQGTSTAQGQVCQDC